MRWIGECFRARVRLSFAFRFASCEYKIFEWHTCTHAHNLAISLPHSRARAQTQTHAHHRMEVDGDGSGDLPMFSILSSGNDEKDPGAGEAGGARGAGTAGADEDKAGSVNGRSKGEKEEIDPPSSPSSGLPLLGGTHTEKYSASSII
jgi:hypothetical protein